MKIVILAGGAGTRLWPMSTKEKPKQFQCLVSEKTMLRETFERLPFVDPKDIYICTNAEYGDLAKKEIPEIPNANFILEPSMQDTGPCIGLAATIIAKDHPEAVMAVVYADHLVQDIEEWEEKLRIAEKLAKEENTLNIIEVKAKYPNVNMGYVKIGQMLTTIDDIEIYELKKFIEKPDYKTAKKFLSSFSYLWNTGYFVWRVDKILAEFKKHLPKTYEQLEAIHRGGLIENHYPKCDKISIDYGIMEKVNPNEVRIIPADLGWNDIGTWKSLHEELAKNPDANLTKGKVLALESTGSVIYNEGKNLVATLGIEDMIVVNVVGFTLVCPKERSSDLKKIINKLNEANEN
ncbi:NTP transferase domain-containing protein [Patescibacteria group bacterium]|nr:NTP transferase domain-containing protein [Patescibacteria group bacterium]